MASAVIKNELVRARVNGAVKEEAEKVLDSIGLSMSDAIRLLATQIAVRHEFPLELKVPNAETRAALAESEDIDQLERLGSINALFE